MIPYHLAFRCLYAATVLICCDGAYMLPPTHRWTVQYSSNTYLSNFTILLYKIVYIDNLEIGNITRNHH